MFSDARFLVAAVSLATVLVTPATAKSSWLSWRYWWSNRSEVDVAEYSKSLLKEWARRRPTPTYGFTEIPEVSDSRAPLVVFLHGLNSRPEDLMQLVQDAAEKGLRCTTFRYPNDQSLQASAAYLSQQLLRVKEAGPVFLVTHSMGALVARAAIEGPRFDPGTVQRLVMIAPPNHGSALARYACSLDVCEYFTSATRRTESGFVAGAVADGLSEALRDLEPHSEFLRGLNQRPRNPRVRYSMLVGTGAPIGQAGLWWLDYLFDTTKVHCSWMGRADRIYRRQCLNHQELITGCGDGFVAVDRARLVGVSDVRLGNFGHNDILQNPTDPEVVRARAWLLERLRP